ncbi:beta-defensin 1 [Carlito syrichta]|uniref:Beta-defensin 1 n=1 Tax=Carlito syrichta TaxID=1868482 RepID=A0A3Q0DIU8_CARSF|nr:beta-defensin 1 [Carlito syrichta]
MGTPYLLLLTVCLLFSQMNPGAGTLTYPGQRSDGYNCVKGGGTCHYSPCPIYKKIEGTCYGGKAKCCK